MIPYARQDLNQSDIDAVNKVLLSDFLTQGEVVPAFENAVGAYCGGRHAVAVNSATSALHISCLALGLGKGDVLWTTPITFVASANCALYCGAKVDFVDIDPQTYNMSVSSLEEKLLEARKNNRLPKIVVAVHFSGQPCDMESISRLSKEFGFKIIEDASHAIGARYKNVPIGSNKYSDICVFSFHPVKIITSGEGGMIVTNDEDIAKKLRLLRSHGISSNKSEMHPHPINERWNYEQIYLGFNYRMTDILAALGLSQLSRLDQFVSRRQVLAKRYDQLLVDVPVTLPHQLKETYSSYHLYPIRLNLHSISKSQQEVYDGLYQEGIAVNIHYIPVYLQPYYLKLGFVRGCCPEAEKYFSECISIPMFSRLTDVQQDKVIAAIRKILR